MAYNDVLGSYNLMPDVRIFSFQPQDLEPGFN